MTKGNIYLIPSAIAPNTQDGLLTAQLQDTLTNTRYFIAENVREARRFISSLKLGITIENLIFFQLDKHNPAKGIRKMLKPALEGNNIGLLSDAGCPGVADPGAEVVKIAHQLGLPVIPLVGPSSIILGLMGSGLSGQNFRFNGYLPVDSKELQIKLRELAIHSSRFNETQIFIETPYRSDKMLSQILNSLNDNTQLCIASNVMSEEQLIMTKSVAEWRKNKPILGKAPTVFLFLS